MRVRWLVSAVCIPLCIALASLGMQAAAFSRPSQDAIAAAHVLKSLLDYRVTRATETLGNRTERAICLQGWFHEPGKDELQRGALVLVDNRERLYDFGRGVRRVGSLGPASPRDKTRFQLAGCSRFVGAKIADRLVRGRPVDVDPVVAQTRPTYAVAFGQTTRMELDVTKQTYTPVGLTLFGQSYRASSALEAGGTRAIVRRMHHAFPFFTRQRRA